MSVLSVSVVVVSYGRAELLARCLTGIGQVCHPAKEIVVVADRDGVAAVHRMGWQERVKLIPFNRANISAARNAGIAASAGEIIAFIDDDAVPEPSWLNNLTAPFADPHVAATGGYVLGRNGISFQWRARAVNAQAEKIALEHDGDSPWEPAPPEGFATKTEGTNAAFRRDVLAKLGGFDPAFRFYLDETDVNLRLAASGGRTMLAPRALVHHGYAASPRRAADRTPRNLHEIAASTAVFLRKHAPEADLDAARQKLRAARRRGLFPYLIDGGLEPRDIGRLLAGLDAGFAEGRARKIAPLPEIGAPAMPFRAFAPGRKPPTFRLIAGRTWQRSRLRSQARAAVADGDIVTLLRLSPTALPHHVQFHEGGWWEQVGGLFGPSERNEPVFRIRSFAARVRKEKARVAKLRHCWTDRRNS